MLLNCAETSLNKAFQIIQITVIVETDLWHTEYWHYAAKITEVIVLNHYKNISSVGFMTG